MSEPKPGRFGSTFKNVKAKAEEAEQNRAQIAIQPQGNTPPPDDNAQEPFSTTLTRRLKRVLKQASAAESRKQFELVEQALEEYLARNHPNLLK